MKNILLDVPENILIDTVGDGTYGGCTIAELVANNSYFYMDNGGLYIETIADTVRVTGTVDGGDFDETYSA